MYKILLLVLFVLVFLSTTGVTVYYGFKMEEVTVKSVDSIAKLRADLDEVRAKNEEIRKEIINFIPTVGMVRSPAYSLVNFYSFYPELFGYCQAIDNVKDYLAKYGLEFQGFRKWLEEKKEQIPLLIDGAVTQVEVSRKVFKDVPNNKGMFDLLKEIEAKIAELTSVNQALENDDISGLITKERDLISRYWDDERKAREQLGDLNTPDSPVSKYVKALDEYLRRKEEYRAELLTLQQHVWEKQARLTQVLIEAENEKRKLVEQRDAIAHKIRSIEQRREEKIIKKVEAGRITELLEDDIVKISIGRADRVFNNSQFNVFRIERGGIKTDVGIIQITKVYEHHSYAKILETFSNFKILAGDAIYSVYYEKDVPNYIVLSGNTALFSREEIANKIRENGDYPQDAIDERTNLCVIGSNYENDELFLKAREKGIKIIREQILLSYLGLVY